MVIIILTCYWLSKNIDNIDCAAALKSSFGYNSRYKDPVLAKKKPDPGLCSSNEGRFLKVYRINILDNFKSLLFFIILVSDVQ